MVEKVRFGALEAHTTARSGGGMVLANDMCRWDVALVIHGMEEPSAVNLVGGHV